MGQVVKHKAFDTNTAEKPIHNPQDEERTESLKTQAYYAKLWVKARNYGSRKSAYLPSSLSAEDFASHFIITRLEGRTSSFHQEFVNYLRFTTGRKGEPGYAARQNLAFARSFNSPLPISKRGRYNERCLGDTLAHPTVFDEFDKDFKRKLERCLRALSQREKEIFIFYVFSEHLLKDIGKMYGISESRTSQILKNIQRKVKKRLKSTIKKGNHMDVTKEKVAVLPPFTEATVPVLVTTAEKQSIDKIIANDKLREDLIIKHNLSNREVEVILEVTNGHSNKLISDKLFVTEKTVKFHLTNIYKKLNVKSRLEAVVLLFKIQRGEA